MMYDCNVSIYIPLEDFTMVDFTTVTVTPYNFILQSAVDSFMNFVSTSRFAQSNE